MLKDKRTPVVILLLSLMATACGACSRSAVNNSAESNAQTGVATNAGNAVEGAANLDATIDRLERQAERNPADDDARLALAKAYVSRGNAMRGASRPREALLDYQKALRNDPDNEEAQKNVAEVTPLVEVPTTGENGEPAPLPISPNVTGADDRPSPTGTPAESNKNSRP